MTRRLTALVAIAALTGASACQQPEPAAPAPPVEPQAIQPAPAAPTVGYACESGATIEARYPDSATAQLTYQGQAYALRTVQAASGARYVGSGVEWWTATRNGQEGATLSRLGPNAQTGVAVLERCSRPSSSAGLPGPAPAPSQTPTVTLSDIALCKGPQLRLAAEAGDAGAGNRVRNFSLQNVGAQACRLTGYPRVSLRDARGRPLPDVRSDRSPGSYFRQGEAPRPVSLAPKSKAYFEVAWTVVPDESQGQTECPAVETVRVTAPDDTAAVSLPFSFAPCGGKIRVSPIRAEANPKAST